MSAQYPPFPLWVVRFKTNGVGFHPIWIGDCKGPNIEQSEVTRQAKQYLKHNEPWLTGIDEIAPFKSVA